MTLVGVLAGLQQQFQLVGVPGAPRLRRLSCLVLGDGGADHAGQRFRKAADLSRGDGFIAERANVFPREMGQVRGARLLGVVPEGQERGALRVGAFQGRQDGGDHAGAEAVVGDRLGRRNPGGLPSGARVALELPDLVKERSDVNSLVALAP